MKKIFGMAALFGVIITCPLFSQEPSEPKPIGKLADIGGYRLHYILTGTGKTTVVLIAGSQAFSFDWTLVQDKVSKFARVLSYDRPCLAWSDPGPAPRTFKQDVYELHKLLEKLNLRAPYILAGHSAGGLIARQYAKEYPAEVSGLLLLDATSENSLLMVNGKVQRVRIQASGKALPQLKYKIDSLTKVPSQKDADDFFKMAGHPSTYPPFDKLPVNIQKIRIWAASQPKFLIADDDPFWAEEFQQMYNDSLGYKLGNIPLIVLTSSRNDYPRQLGDSLRNVLIADKIKNHDKMLMLSTNSKRIATDKSGHEIHLTEPELVVSAIKAIIDSNHSGKKLNK